VRGHLSPKLKQVPLERVPCGAHEFDLFDPPSRGAYGGPWFDLCRSCLGDPVPGAPQPTGLSGPRCGPGRRYNE
jgi:hypothetical protein